MKKSVLVDITDKEIHIESLRRTADRCSASTYSTLLGVGFVVATQWSTSHTDWLIAFVLIRVALTMLNHQTGRQIHLLGATVAHSRGYAGRLVAGLGAGGASWALLVGLLEHPGSWDLNDLFLIVALVMLSALMLVTTAYMWQAMVAFTVSLWLLSLTLLFALHSPLPWQFAVAVPVVCAVLLFYGLQLHRQSRQGVVLDLINRRLNADLELANAQLHTALATSVEMATRDPLTKAYNRRAFRERAQAEAASMRRQREPACVLMLDLDHFKAINDVHGHAMGDSVLAHTCMAAQSCLRDIDTLARWGGEEFAVLMPRTSLESGLLVAERIRLAVAEQRQPELPHDLRVRTSIGVATWQINQTVESALSQADTALYQAKQLGRDRVAASAVVPAATA